MGMVYEAIEASRWSRSVRWSVPLPRFAGGVLAVGQSAGQAYDGVKAWQEGERVKATVKFVAAAGAVMALLGPVGAGISAVVGIGTLCYDHRDKIRQML